MGIFFPYQSFIGSGHRCWQGLLERQHLGLEINFFSRCRVSRLSGTYLDTWRLSLHGPGRAAQWLSGDRCGPHSFYSLLILLLIRCFPGHCVTKSSVAIFLKHLTFGIGTYVAAIFHLESRRCMSFLKVPIQSWEFFFGSDFEFCTISLLVILEY